MAYEELYQKLINVYGLSKDDFWMHKQSGKLIIKHAGVQKIAYQDLPNKTKIVVPELKNYIVHQNSDGLRGKELVISAQFELHHDGVCLRRYVSFGEANEKNLRSDYPWAIAEKRMFDRAVLALVGLAQEGVYSDEEADTFRDPKQKVKLKPPEAAEDLPKSKSWVEVKEPVMSAPARPDPVPMPPRQTPHTTEEAWIEGGKAPVIRRNKDLILNFLESRPGESFSRNDICDLIDISTNEFSSPLSRLIMENKVAKSGEKRGTKYTAIKGMVEIKEEPPVTTLSDREYNEIWPTATNKMRDIGLLYADIKEIVREKTGYETGIEAQQNKALSKELVEEIVIMGQELRTSKERLQIQ